MNKASGGGRIPVEVFQVLKDDAVKVLHSICQQIWKTQQWPQHWKKSAFILLPKKGNAKECSNYHTVKSFGIVNIAKVDIFLELSCLFDGLTDIGNLTSGSSAFSKSSLNIWKFIVHVLLKPGLKNFEHYFASV